MNNQDIKEMRQSVFFMCMIAVKSIIAGMVLIFGMMFILTPAAEAATLKTLSVVNDDVIRVGDLFDGTSEASTAAVLGRAPQPGSDMTISARTLSRIASKYQIDWTPQATDQVIVRRDAHTVGATEFRDALKDAFETRGVEGSYSVSLNGTNPAIVLPRNLPATAEVTNLKYTPGRDDFTATLATPSAANPVKTINVSGVIERTIEVPVLKASARSGDIIGSTDIEWVDVSQRLLAKDAIVDADRLIGKTPTRVIEMGAPIRIKDVTNPQLISRGDEITIIVKEGGMQLTAKGKAMQNGAEGDMIRAVNVTSNRSLTAMVTGDRTVTVQ